MANKQTEGGSKPFPQGQGEHSIGRAPLINPSVIPGMFSPRRVLFITIGGIALAEVIAMVVVYFFRDWSYTRQVILDASVMTIIIFPLLYLLSFKPLIRQIQQRTQSESILQARLRLIEHSITHSLDELLQFALDEIEALTGSSISFLHFLEADQQTLWLQTWSSNTLKNMCTAEGKGSHYPIEQAGVWADAARQRQPVIHNDYRTLLERKGLPEGHAPILRELVIPVLRDKDVVAVLGVGNKAQDYTHNDVEAVSTFADFAWDVIEHKRADLALQESEQKFRTFIDWAHNWEHWLDPDGKIIHTAPVCERITGYTSAEFIADPDLLNRIVHPDDRLSYEKHVDVAHAASMDPITIEFRIIARDGSEHWLEHICRPILGTGGGFQGRRVSNRDVTQHKLAEKQIAEQNQREVMLNHTIQTIQTDIARDLHDTLGQNISFLSLNLKYLSEAPWITSPETRLQLQNMNLAANESYELVRSMLAVLQTGDSTDPLSLFTRYADQVAKRSELQIDISVHGVPKRMSPNQIRQLFYIYREALNNIEKYANPGYVTAEFIWNDNTLTTVISDNGRGFDPDASQPAGHYGLKFMRERVELLNGTFFIHSAPGHGTKITIHIPYESEPIYQAQ